MCELLFTIEEGGGWQSLTASLIDSLLTTCLVRSEGPDLIEITEGFVLFLVRLCASWIANSDYFRRTPASALSVLMSGTDSMI